MAPALQVSPLSSEAMATAFRLFVGLVAALALSKHFCLAEANTTEPASPTGPRHRHGNRDNCTVTPESGWNGHFSQCPDHLRHYCIHGECRYIKVQKAPSCRCQPGYSGSRCEYLNMDEQKADKRNIIIICIIAGLVLLILIVFICVCSRHRRRMCWRRGRRSEEPRNWTEKLSMMDAAETHAALKSLDSREPLPHSNSV